MFSIHKQYITAADPGATPQQVWPLLCIYRTTVIIGVLLTIGTQQYQQTHNKYNNKQAQQQQAHSSTRTTEGRGGRLCESEM